MAMRMNPYVSFNGNCEAAFKFYEQWLGAKPGGLFRYAGSPMASQAPADWGDKVMHGSVTIGDQELMGADLAPGQYEAPKGIGLSLQIKSVSDAERVFAGLADGGTVVMPLQQTFWAARFGVVTDRFGVPWQINCEGAEAAV
jgi:PhnB protein